MTAKELILEAWNFDLAGFVLLTALLAGFFFCFGQPRSGRLSYTAAAVTLLVVSVFSPIGTLADGYLFSAHMLQHLLLLLVIPVLLLNGAPVNQKAAHDSLGWARTGLGWLCGVGAMWIWHAPALCNAAATHSAVFWLQVVSLLVFGGLFWWPISGPNPGDRLFPLAGIMYLFTACAACTMLGIYLTFTPVSICSAYAHPVDRLGVLNLLRGEWGLTPAVDQQIGGLLMWVPACLIYLGGIIGLLVRWYGSDDTETGSGDSFAPGPANQPVPRARPT